MIDRKYGKYGIVAAILLLAAPVDSPRAEPDRQAWEHATAPVTATRDFRDWRAQCREGGFCEAESSGEAFKLRVARLPKFDDQGPGERAWAISIHQSGVAPSAEAAFRIRVDDETPMTLRPPAQVTRLTGPDNEGDAVYITDESLMMTLLAQLGKARILFVSGNEFADPRDESWSPVSLSGLTASLLWIDEQQGRVGAPRIADFPSWLGRVGEEPDQAGGRSPPQALIDAHRHAGDCRQPGDADRQLRPFAVHRLSDGSTLYIFECNQYAYNADNRLYIVDRYGELSTVSVPTFDNRGFGATTLVPFADFDPDRMRLFSSHKGRGIGDCGSSNIWRWDGYTGFILVQSRYQDCVDRMGGEEPEAMPVWPVVYRLGLDDLSVLNGAPPQ